MTLTRQTQNAFSSGEISPLLYRRDDYQRHQTGLRTCRGFLPMRQGGVTRAPGTWHRGTTHNNQPAKFVSFEFAVNDVVMLEFTPFIMRVWRYGQLIEGGGSPYTLATPYDAAALGRLYWEQSYDAIYIADGVSPVQKLTRMALDDWAITPFEGHNGPFRPSNLEEGKTIQAAGNEGVGEIVTLTSNFDIFTADHVGGLMHFEAFDHTTVPLWSAGQTVAAGEYRRYGEYTYQLVLPNHSSIAVGQHPPTHTRGLSLHYAGQIIWKYICDREGIVKITAVTSPTEATATVQRSLPLAIISDGTYLWSEGAWSENFEYPTALDMVQQRLVFASLRTVFFSTAGAIEDFEPGTEPDSAFTYSIAGASQILWLKEGREGLHIGTLGAELSTRVSGNTKRIGIDTIDFGTDSAVGSKNVRPIAPDGNPIFISKDGKRLFEAQYSLQDNANRPVELSLPASHLGAPGFEDLIWQSSPQRLVWLRRGDGTVAVMLYDKQEKVLGWAVWTCADGVVIDIASAPSADGSTDTILLCVARELDGATVHCVEEMALTFGVQQSGVSVDEVMHFFCGQRFEPVAPTDTFLVPHLAGEVVYAWTDIGTQGPFTVAGDGTVVLDHPVNTANIGLFDVTHEFETLDLAAPAREGNSHGRLKSLRGKPGLSVFNTAGGTVSVRSRHAAGGQSDGGPTNLIQTAVMAAAPQLYSGPVSLDISSPPAHEVALVVRPVGGAPLTVLDLTPPMKEAGA